MFEPKTYQEKRNSLNEMLIQQMANVAMRNADEQGKVYLRDVMERFAIGQSRLRDAEALRILGPVEFDGTKQYANAGVILNYLKSNLGRTYFSTPEPTAAADGSIGTAGFGKKYKDWMDSLPQFDQCLGKNMQSGFYADYSTMGPDKPMAVLVLRHGQEIIMIAYREYMSALTLQLDHVPEAYNWNATNHYALRGEMFTYRGNLTIEEFEQLFAQALSGHTSLGLQIPEPLPMSDVVETVGYSQVIEADPAANEDVAEPAAEIEAPEVTTEVVTNDAEAQADRA